MSWLNMLGIAVGLAMDALAVSVAIGLSLARVTPRHTFRIAFHFGLFQFIMPILGWLGGNVLAPYIGAWDHWIAFGLLGYVGGKMLWEAGSERNPGGKADPTRGVMLVTLSIATSIDALAVGLSMAMIHVSIWGPSVVIGLVAAALSAIGITFGRRFGSRWGYWAEVAGGGVLLVIGTRILLSHLLG
ncbi:MAG: manganese efflux pump MntP family protein [Planctomycetia bacterium]|nr:manganese efflux pump MntP family protein [Planctomycetia bacterium]